MAYKIFISSAYKDIDLARDLAQRLEDAGVDVYSVDKTVIGEKIETAIMRSLTKADEVIVILTDDSVNSRGLMYELGAASSLRKRITPVIVGIDANKLPSLIKNMQFVKYADLSKYISDLEKRAKEAA